MPDYLPAQNMRSACTCMHFACNAFDSTCLCQVDANAPLAATAAGLQQMEVQKGARGSQLAHVIPGLVAPPTASLQAAIPHLGLAIGTGPGGVLQAVVAAC